MHYVENGAKKIISHLPRNIKRVRGINFRTSLTHTKRSLHPQAGDLLDLQIYTRDIVAMTLMIIITIIKIIQRYASTVNRIKELFFFPFTTSALNRAVRQVEYEKKTFLFFLPRLFLSFFFNSYFIQQFYLFVPIPFISHVFIPSHPIVISFRFLRQHRTDIIFYFIFFFLP